MEERSPLLVVTGFEKKNKQERKTGGVGGWQLVKDAF